jgi:hypothetical protein
MKPTACMIQRSWETVNREATLVPRRRNRLREANDKITCITVTLCILVDTNISKTQTYIYIYITTPILRDAAHAAMQFAKESPHMHTVLRTTI